MSYPKRLKDFSTARGASTKYWVGEGKARPIYLCSTTEQLGYWKCSAQNTKDGMWYHNIRIHVWKLTTAHKIFMIFTHINTQKKMNNCPYNKLFGPCCKSVEFRFSCTFQICKSQLEIILEKTENANATGKTNTGPCLLCGLTSKYLLNVWHCLNEVTD